MDEDIFRKLEERLGPLHARQRLGIETDHEAQIFGQDLLSFHIGNWYPVHSVIRNALKLTGLYRRARRNTERILVKRNDVMFKELPPLFDCPSADNLRLVRCFEKEGSGSSGLEFRRPAADAASVGLR